MIEEVQVGELMREIRKKKGFTSTQIAEKLMISQPKLSRIETGTQPVPISLLSKFCILCQITLVDFFRMLEERTEFRQYIKENPTGYEGNVSEQADKLLADLTMEEKKAIVNLIKVFSPDKLQ